MAETVTLVCDMCANPADSKIQVGPVDGGVVHVDLCDDCYDQYVAPLMRSGRLPETSVRRPYKRFHLTELPPQPADALRAAP